MTDRIERFDRERKYLRGAQIVAMVLFFINWVIFCGLEISGSGEGKFAKTMLIFIYAFVAALVLIGIRLRRNAYLINHDPVLKEALNNELVRLNRLRAWKAAFFGMLVCLVMTGILSQLFEIKNLLILSSAVIVGLGTRNIVFYLLDR
jgi:magnesium-transporting ATPase (P-type)